MYRPEGRETCWACGGADGVPVPPPNTRDHLVEWLETGPASTSDLADVLGVSAAHVRRQASALLAAGVVTTGGPGQRRVYELA